MSHEPIIEVRNIGKRYEISHDRGRYVALRDVMANIFKSPFAFLKTKAKQAAGLEKKEEFWALRGVDFTVNKGEVIGIIGRNGAGKSTLLKVLSQITPPTTGEITIRGRVGSLLEVGTGFHPELTGRENIFLNGAILGMKKKEIAGKFDDIVEFAGIERFLDTPVKYYSSGMYVRLAFSVAAHMEPDVLIIDEVLAVGDAEFQKKCIGKMDEITKKEGRTILFVSHNMEAITQLCPKTIFLKNGMIAGMGPTEEILAQYSSDFIARKEGTVALAEKKDTEATFTNISLIGEKGAVITETEYAKDFSIVLDMKVIKDLHDADVSLSLTNSRGADVVFSSLSDAVDGKLKDFAPGAYSFKTTFKGGFLMPGNYYARISIHYPGSKNIDTREDVIGFRITEPAGKRAVNYGMGSVSIPAHWTQK